MACQPVQRDRIHIVKVIEHGRLVPTEEVLRMRVAHVARVTRKVDAGVQGHQLARRIGWRTHAVSWANYFALSNQIKFLQIVLNQSVATFVQSTDRSQGSPTVPLKN
jgi:hypothetical protein